MKTTNVKLSNDTKLIFKAGKTKFYTDFDGTYFPFPQNAITSKKEPYYSLLKNMYSLFYGFKKNAKEKFNTIITTGRSKIELKTAKNDIISAGIDFPAIEYFILRDGLDKSKDIDNKAETSLPNDLNKIKNDIECIVKSIDRNIVILFPTTNKSIQNDYLNSFESLHGKLPNHHNNRYISIVMEDNGIIELMFAPNINTKEYLDRLTNYINTNELQYEVDLLENDKNFWVPSQNNNNEKKEWQPANVIILTPIKQGKAPNKLEEPKNAVKEIIQRQTNDLVIVAGNDSNDEEMLNPLNYLDILNIDIDKSASIEDTLQRNEVLEGIKKLPFISIVVGNSQSLNKIRQIKKNLDKKGIHRIFSIENPSDALLKKIKYGMLVYSEENKKYKYSLGYDLYKELLNNDN